MRQSKIVTINYNNGDKEQLEVFSVWDQPFKVGFRLTNKRPFKWMWVPWASVKNYVDEK